MTLKNQQFSRFINVLDGKIMNTPWTFRSNKQTYLDGYFSYDSCRSFGNAYIYSYINAHLGCASIKMLGYNTLCTYLRSGNNSETGRVRLRTLCMLNQMPPAIHIHMCRSILRTGAKQWPRDTIGFGFAVAHRVSITLTFLFRYHYICILIINRVYQNLDSNFKAMHGPPCW